MQLRREAESLLAERKAELSKKSGPVAKGAHHRNHDSAAVLKSCRDVID